LADIKRAADAPLPHVTLITDLNNTWTFIWTGKVVSHFSQMCKKVGYLLWCMMRISFCLQDNRVLRFNVRNRKAALEWLDYLLCEYANLALPKVRLLVLSFKLIIT
jgi:hypothetical protein